MCEYVYVHVCVCMYVCMYVCVYVCLCVAHNLFLGKPDAGEEIDGLFLPKLHIVPQQKDEQQLAHILLLLIAIQSIT